MTDQAPSSDDWRVLYALMAQVKEMAPWTWMDEANVFGVQDPDDGEIGFVSVMGALGEHFAVAVYRGAGALHHFWAYQALGSSARVEDLLDLPQLQASFEDRDQLSDRDRRVIKDLALKFRGKQAWPLFRSYRPGYLPWFLEAPEARCLSHALRQLLEVAPRFRADHTLFPVPLEERYLVRVPQGGGEGVTWEDRIVAVPPPEERPIQITIDTAELNAVERLPRGNMKVELECDKMLTYVQEEPGARPVFPYVLLAVDARTGMLLGQHMQGVETTLDALWSEVPGHTLHLLLQIGQLPQEVALRSPELYNVLAPLAGRLGIQLVPARRLPALEPIWASLEAFLRR